MQTTTTTTTTTQALSTDAQQVSPVSTLSSLATAHLAPRPLAFTRHPEDVHPDRIRAREMFRGALAREYALLPLNVKIMANGPSSKMRAHTGCFLLEKTLLDKKVSVWEAVKLFSIMRIDIEAALPPTNPFMSWAAAEKASLLVAEALECPPITPVDAYVINLYALDPRLVSHALRRLDCALDRLRERNADPNAFTAEERLMDEITLTPPQSDDEDEDYEPSKAIPRTKRPAASTTLHSSPKRHTTGSRVVARAQATGFPEGWIREDRIAPAGKSHVVVISPSGAVYSSLVKARNAAGVF